MNFSFIELVVLVIAAGNRSPEFYRNRSYDDVGSGTNELTADQIDVDDHPQRIRYRKWLLCPVVIP